MKRESAIQLNNALADKVLRVKNISSDNFLNIHYIKVGLRGYLDEMGEKETELCKGWGVTEFPDKSKKGNQGFYDTLKVIQSTEFDHKNLNSLTSEDFFKFIAEMDFHNASVLTEFLLKKD